MNDEKLKILEMIAQGKISPEEGVDLMEALESEVVGDARWLCIRVSEPDIDKIHVNLRIPISWAGKILKLIKAFARDVEIDMDEMYKAIQAGEPGQIIDINTEGHQIEIWLEV